MEQAQAQLAEWPLLSCWLPDLRRRTLFSGTCSHKFLCLGSFETLKRRFTPLFDSVRHISWNRLNLHLQQNFWRCWVRLSSRAANETRNDWTNDDTNGGILFTILDAALAEDLNAQNLEIKWDQLIFKRGHCLLYQSDIFLLGSQSQKSERLVTGETCDNMFQSRNHQTDTNPHCPGSAFARTEQHWAALCTELRAVAKNSSQLLMPYMQSWNGGCMRPYAAVLCRRIQDEFCRNILMEKPTLSVENSFTTCSALLRLALDTIVALCLILGMATQSCTTTHPVFWRPLLKCGFRMKFCPQPRPAPYFFLAALQHESQVTPMRFKQELCISSSLLT